jgi:hypothetical protein
MIEVTVNIAKAKTKICINTYDSDLLMPRMLREFIIYRSRVKTGPGKIDEDIKLARQQRMRRYRREKVLSTPMLSCLRGHPLHRSKRYT